MLKKLAAALAMSLVPLTSFNAASSQSMADVSNEFNSLAAWMAEVRPIAEDLFDVFLPVDDADAAFYAYLQGELNDEELRQSLAQSRQNIQDLSDALLARFDALPPPPGVGLGDIKFGENDSTSKLPELLESLTISALSSIDSYEEAIDGDEESIQRVNVVNYNQMIASIETANVIAEADRVSIPDVEHPQRSVIACGILSNTSFLNILKFERSKILNENTDAQIKHIEDMKDNLYLYQAEIERGKRRQAASLAKMKLAANMVSADQKEVVQRVVRMVEAYSDAWVVEAELLELLKEVPVAVENARTSDELEAVISRVIDRAGPLEEQREKLIFDRIAMIGE